MFLVRTAKERYDGIVSLGERLTCMQPPWSLTVITECMVANRQCITCQLCYNNVGTKLSGSDIDAWLHFLKWIHLWWLTVRAQFHWHTVSFIIYTVDFSFSLNTRLVGSVIKIPATDLADPLMEVQRELKSTVPCSAGLQSLVSTRLTTWWHHIDVCRLPHSASYSTGGC